MNEQVSLEYILRRRLYKYLCAVRDGALAGPTPRVRDVLSEWLQQRPWTWFFTVTFARPARYPRQALSRLQSIHWLCSPCDMCERGYTLKNGKSVTSCVLIGRHYRTFVAAEPHAKGDYHVHGLLFHKCADSTDRLMLERGLRRRFGFSRVDAPHSIGGVAGYAAKYITKQTADWDVHGWGPSSPD